MLNNCSLILYLHTLQGAHPHPGKPYTAKCLFGNIPNTRDGHELKRLLQKAFSSRQLVAVGSDDNLNWNNVGFAQDIRYVASYMKT